jgi:hypothetical protein
MKRGFGPATRKARLLGLALTLLATVGSGCSDPREGYAPQQPIAYSHKLHAGDLRIDCRYCHVWVDESRHASVPSTNICMNCHAAVGKSKDGVIKLTKHYDEGRPVPWVKVHDLPDFAYFNHSRHIAQGFECEKCHGKVEEMEVVSLQNRFNMGWCVDCHRNPDEKRPELKGPIDCSICHR